MTDASWRQQLWHKQSKKSKNSNLTPKFFFGNFKKLTQYQESWEQFSKQVLGQLVFLYKNSGRKTDFFLAAFLYKNTDWPKTCCEDCTHDCWYCESFLKFPKKNFGVKFEFFDFFRLLTSLLLTSWHVIHFLKIVF